MMSRKSMKRELVKLLEDQSSAVVSFDFFDTLFIRMVSEPEDVFDIVGNIAKIENFKELRKKAQIAAFQEMHDKGLKEIGIDDIYNNFIELNEKQKETLKELEFKVELEVVKPNPELKSIFKKLVDSNRKVVITSDMYLYDDFFEQALIKNEMPVVELLVSSTLNATKRDVGELFDVLKSKFNTSDIVHIGDNYRSDVEMANFAGLESFYYKHSQPVIGSRDSDTTAISVIRSLNRYYASDAIEGTLDFDAFRLGGAAALGFYKWVVAQAKSDKVDKLLFLSRDGYLLKELLDLTNELPKEKYAYFKGSRTVFTLASINEGNYENYIPYLASGSIGLSPKEVFERIGVNSPSQNVLNNLGFFDDMKIGEPACPDVSDLLLLYRSEILKVCFKTKRALYKYLTQLGIEDGMTVGFVDIGWRGTSQDAFEKAIKGMFEFNIIGYYFSLVDIVDNSCATSTKKALFNRSNSSPSFIDDIYKNRVAFEMFFSAPHNSIVGYDFNLDNIVYLEDDGRGNASSTHEMMTVLSVNCHKFYYCWNQISESLMLNASPEELLQPLIEFALSGKWKNQSYIQRILNFDAWSSSKNNNIKPGDY